MSLADRTPERTKRAGGTCSIAMLYETIDDEDEAVLRSWMADRSLSARAIHREIVDEFGYPHSDQTVARHRRHRSEGGCMCEDL